MSTINGSTIEFLDSSGSPLVEEEIHAVIDPSSQTSFLSNIDFNIGDIFDGLEFVAEFCGAILEIIGSLLSDS